MSRRLASLLFGAVAATALPADAPSVGGEWRIQYNVFAKEGEQTCTFTQAGSEINGTCGKNSDSAAGKVEGSRVTWRIKTLFDGAPTAMEFSGTLVSGEKIAGTVILVDAGVDGEFTATKKKQEHL